MLKWRHTLTIDTTMNAAWAALSAHYLELERHAVLLQCVTDDYQDTIAWLTHTLVPDPPGTLEPAAPIAAVPMTRKAPEASPNELAPVASTPVAAAAASLDAVLKMAREIRAADAQGTTGGPATTTLPVSGVSTSPAASFLISPCFRATRVHLDRVNDLWARLHPFYPTRRRSSRSTCVTPLRQPLAVQLYTQIPQMPHRTVYFLSLHAPRAAIYISHNIDQVPSTAAQRLSANRQARLASTHSRVSISSARLTHSASAAAAATGTGVSTTTAPGIISYVCVACITV
jgi:hypothetical protein